MQGYYYFVGVAIATRGTHHTKGAFNLVLFVNVLFSDRTAAKAIVRVPARGVKAHWTPEDAYMEREVQLVDHISKSTSAPASIILECSTDLRDDSGFPYTLMTGLPGQGAFSIWFDKLYDPVNPSGAYRDADIPSTET